MYMWIIAIVILALSIILTMLISSAKKQDQIQPAQIKDFKFPIPDEGTPQIVTFGDVWTQNWQVLSVSNYKTEPVYASGSSGKK